MEQFIDFSQIDILEWILIAIASIVYILIGWSFMTMIRITRKKLEKDGKRNSNSKFSKS